jgi:hypothetical protein
MGLSQHFFLAYKASIQYITYMATQKPQILLTLDDKLLKRIDDYRYENRIPARSEAVRQLIEVGLKKQKKKPKK